MDSPRSEPPRRTTGWIGAAVGMLAITAASAWIWSPRTERSAANLQHLETLAASRRDIVRRVEATGTLRPQSVIHVGSLVSGVIAAAPVAGGDHVDAGQVIARVDDTAYRQQVDRAEAALASARLREALARGAWARQRALAAQGFVSAAAVEDGRLQAAMALQDVLSARSAVASARLDLAHCVIRSPISGLVLTKEIAAGQSVASAFQVPDLYTIVSNLDPLEVVAMYSEADLSFIAPGDHATMSVPAWPARHFDARVERVLDTPESRQGVVMFPVVLICPNPQGLLRPGMTAFVQTRVISRRAVLAVPNAAIAWARGHDRAAGLPSPLPSRVYTLVGDRLAPVDATFGDSDDQYTEIQPMHPLNGTERIVWKERP